MPEMYDDLAPWWPLLSAPDEYEEEAGFYWQQLAAASRRPVRTLLELGSGGGNNASHLKRHATMTLVEPAAGMRAVSAALNPECEHIDGDMRTVRLGRTFDAVFVHDAVCYMTTEADLRAAMATAFVHCAPDGAVLFAPDYVRETFQPGTEEGGRDDGARGLRYLEWMWDPDPTDTTYSVDYAFLLREADGTVRAVHDRHIEGLFSRAEWLRWLAEAGFVDVRAVPFDHSELEPGAHEVFVARKERRNEGTKEGRREGGKEGRKKEGMSEIRTGFVWPLAALPLAMAAVACSPDRGLGGRLPDAPPSPLATVGPTRGGNPGASEPPSPPVLPAFERTVLHAGFADAPEGADACNRSTRDGLLAFRAAAYSVAEGHLRAAMAHCGASLDVLVPLGLTQLWRQRYVGAMSYLQPALALADGTTADEIRWYLGIAHHRTAVRSEAYRHWDIVCAGTSQFSAIACETLQALRAHDAELTAWRLRAGQGG